MNAGFSAVAACCLCFLGFGFSCKGFSIIFRLGPPLSHPSCKDVVERKAHYDDKRTTRTWLQRNAAPHFWPAARTARGAREVVVCQNARGGGKHDDMAEPETTATRTDLDAGREPSIEGVIFPSPCGSAARFAPVIRPQPGNRRAQIRGWRRLPPRRECCAPWDIRAR